MRTSTNMGIAGGIAAVAVGLLQMFTGLDIPPGFEAGLAVLVAVPVGRWTKTPKNPGAL